MHERGKVKTLVTGLFEDKTSQGTAHDLPHAVDQFHAARGKLLQRVITTQDFDTSPLRDTLLRKPRITHSTDVVAACLDQ